MAVVLTLLHWCHSSSATVQQELQARGSRGWVQTLAPRVQPMGLGEQQQGCFLLWSRMQREAQRWLAGNRLPPPLAVFLRRQHFELLGLQRDLCVDFIDGGPTLLHYNAQFDGL